MLGVGDRVEVRYGEHVVRLVVEAVDGGADLFPITLFSQRSWLWMDEPLAGGTYTIGQAGCALTCAAMVASQVEPGINPLILNHRLQDNEGFTDDSLLLWEKVVDCVVPQIVGTSIVYEGPTNRWKDGELVWRNVPADMGRVMDELADGPCIMEVDFVPGGALQTHYVLAVGCNQERTDIYIYDPWDGVRTLLLQRYAKQDWILARAVYGLRLLRAVS